MRLSSLTLKGFKSFPDRTRLEFGPGVSVVVGPNGSGKSNVTDAVLWAMGEQSPLAVRGQSMQDVIFGGGRGVAPRSAAEVEIVLDNSDGELDVPLSEISIVRRLDRNGEGEYRLNGARCRLADVIEVLSDTGLGKETHSVISQGRVDAIVSSRPRDRRLLIEEAAGLGKHRKRRRRAQLKLERTQENLDRALDVEREARTRLRPLKRQSEAAELHERLERQTLETRLELVGDLARVRDGELAAAEAQVAAARADSARIEQRLAEIVERRGAAERALAQRGERLDAHARRVYETRSARERLALRAEQADAAAAALARRLERSRVELAALEDADAAGDSGAGAAAVDGGDGAADPPRAGGAAGGDRALGGADPVATLEAELQGLAAKREDELGRELAELESEAQLGAGRLADAEGALAAARAARDEADTLVERERGRLATAEQAAATARRESERVGAELAAVNQFLSAHARLADEDDGDSPRLLSEQLRVAEGYELALAAALGGRLDAAVVTGLAGANALLDRAGPDGGTALLVPADEGRSADAPTPGSPPLPGARSLVELVTGPAPVLALAARLLADAWVVDSLEQLPPGFTGIATTRAGRAYFAPAREVRQLGEGGSERVLARRNERDRLIVATADAASAETASAAETDAARLELGRAERARGEAAAAVHGAERAQLEAAEGQRRTAWLIEQRRAAPAQGAVAVRMAELEGELAAERRAAERRAGERAARLQRTARLRAQIETDLAAEPRAARLGSAIATAREAVASRLVALEDELAAEREAGDAMAGELSACAASEAEIQTQLRAAGEAVTAAEVAAQRVRDLAAETAAELSEVRARLGHGEQQPPQGDAPAPLTDEERAALEARLARLERRREQLGPVNPLAQREYAEAVEHVEELERQREDLETALRELRGIIRETDREIARTFEETFAAAARNFEELVQDVFPGGSGALRLVAEERAPRPVLGGQSLGDDPATRDEASEAEADAEAEAEADHSGAAAEELLGVEIEITPQGKSTKRLSLLSGGEKSMTALAFLFAVFLARPCPFYILDEVEAALDDLNLDRFLALLRRYADRAQFIVITHQKRTMEAADWLYGVSMGDDGVSKVLSRKLPPERADAAVARVA